MTPAGSRVDRVQWCSAGASHRWHSSCVSKEHISAAPETQEPRAAKVRCCPNAVFQPEKCVLWPSIQSKADTKRVCVTQDFKNHQFMHGLISLHLQVGTQKHSKLSNYLSFKFFPSSFIEWSASSRLKWPKAQWMGYLPHWKPPVTSSLGRRKEMQQDDSSWKCCCVPCRASHPIL